MRWLLIGFAACGASTSSPIDAALGDGFLDFDAGGPARLFLGSSSLQDFGSVSIGQPVERDVIVTNGGGQQSGVPIATITGTDAASWSLSTGCANLETGESCLYPLQFTPATTGNKVAQLSVTANPGGTVNVALKGTGVAATITATPPSVTFPATIVRQTSAPTTITFKNVGAIVSDPASTSLSGATPGDFEVVADACNGVALPPNGTCTMSVAFLPSTATTITAMLGVSANPLGGVSVLLSGTGTP